MGARSSNRGEIVGNWGSNIPRIRTRGTKPRYLTNREVYNYFKDCSLVKSHKLSGAIEKNLLPLEFMGDLMGPDGEVFQGNSPNI